LAGAVTVTVFESISLPRKCAKCLSTNLTFLKQKAEKERGEDEGCRPSLCRRPSPPRGCCTRLWPHLEAAEFALEKETLFSTGITTNVSSAFFQWLQSKSHLTIFFSLSANSSFE
jgi:hypothetical protein